VFNLSASANLMAPSSPISLSVLSENHETKQQVLLLRISEVKEGFDLIESDNLITPSVPSSPVLSEN
jgi:hypothetical protein